jgi:hypothetical protein
MSKKAGLEHELLSSFTHFLTGFSTKTVSVVALIIRIWGLCLALVLLLSAGEAQAGQLADRLAQFPTWESKPPVAEAKGDLIYPDWMEGTWKVTSTLIDLLAPLAPEVVTPGFEGNRRYLNQPVSFLVRFQAANDLPKDSDQGTQTVISDRFLPIKTYNRDTTPTNSGSEQLPSPYATREVVADRAFNGLNIAEAYLGDRMIQSVKVDPNSPNRQITSLSTGRQLVSVVTGRASETPAPDQFIATELSQQIFRGTPQLYFNQVETTTAYQLLREAKLPGTAEQNPEGSESPSLTIEGDQITAIYLSPQDPDYFKAQAKPVALYRYRLELLPEDKKPWD